MGRFDKRYSDDDRLAMMQLADKGLRPKQIAAVLETDGYAPLGIAPHRRTIPYQSVRKIVQMQRQKAAPKTLSPLASRQPDEAVTELRARLITVAEREVNQLIREQAGKGLDIGKLDKMASVLVRLHATTKATDPAPRVVIPDNTRESPDTFASRLSRAPAPTPTTSNPQDGPGSPAPAQGPPAQPSATNEAPRT